MVDPDSAGCFAFESLIAIRDHAQDNGVIASPAMFYHHGMHRLRIRIVDKRLLYEPVAKKYRLIRLK